MKCSKTSFGRIVVVSIVCVLLIPTASLAEIHHLTILHTNDHNGHFMKFSPWGNPEVGGMAARSTLVNIVRAEVEQAGGHVLLLSAEGFFRVGTQWAFLTYLVLFLQRALNLHLVAASLLFAIAQAGGAAGRIIWGLVSDRLFGGKRKVVYTLIGLLAMAIFSLLGQLKPSTEIWVLLSTVACLGFTAAGFQGVALTLMAECAGPELTGTATGFGQSLCFLGGVVISPVFGFVVDTTGSFSSAEWSFAVAET